jgi:hypothetical protein
MLMLAVAESLAVPLLAWTVTVKGPAEEYVCELLAGPGENPLRELSPQCQL